MQPGGRAAVQEKRSIRMKKRMTILSMVLVLALSFAGCGKKPAEAPADAAAPAEEAVQETPEETSESYLVLVMDSLAFCMMYSVHELNQQGDNIQP